MSGKHTSATPNHFDAARAANDVVARLMEADGIQYDDGTFVWERGRLAPIITAALVEARKAPEGHVIDDRGVVRNVLGTLPITADGCVVGEGASPAFWIDGNIIIEGRMGCEPQAYFPDPNVPAMIFSPNAGVKSCYSTSEAAEAAKEKA